MNRLLVILSTVGLTLSWPSFSFSELAHPQESAGQGAATGRPEMRDPHGVDKDREREETGNQGRPIDKQVKPVNLPAPTDVSVSMNPGVGACSSLPAFGDKILGWKYTPEDPRITGFKLYEQSPGEKEFHLAQTIPLSLGQGAYRLRNGTNGPVAWCGGVQQAIDDGSLTVFLMKPYIGVVERHTIPNWPEGTYRHYVVPVNAAGQEGARSPIVPCTKLKEMQLIRPKQGEATGGNPVFQWTDIVPKALRPPTWGWTLYGLSLWDGQDRSTEWRKFMRTDSTSCQYDGPPLKPGKKYYLNIYAEVADTGTPLSKEYGVSLGTHQYPFVVTVSEKAPATSPTTPTTTSGSARPSTPSTQVSQPPRGSSAPPTQRAQPSSRGTAGGSQRR